MYTTCPWINSILTTCQGQSSKYIVLILKSISMFMMPGKLIFNLECTCVPTRIDKLSINTPLFSLDIMVAISLFPINFTQKRCSASRLCHDTFLLNSSFKLEAMRRQRTKVWIRDTRFLSVLLKMNRGELVYESRVFLEYYYQTMEQTPLVIDWISILSPLLLIVYFGW